MLLRCEGFKPLPMSDIIVKTIPSKIPQVSFRAVSEHGVKALSEIHGSRCTCITLVMSNLRLKNAKKTLEDMGCVVS